MGLPVALAPTDFRRTITSPFGWRFDPKWLIPRKHEGIDVGGPRGTPILATKPGVVMSVGRHPERGLNVVIDHGGGVTSSSLHLDRADVVAGRRVGEGQRIGTMGATGRVTGVHLHLTTARRGAAFDPMEFLGLSWPGWLVDGLIVGGVWYWWRRVGSRL